MFSTYQDNHRVISNNGFSHTWTKGGKANKLFCLAKNRLTQGPLSKPDSLFRLIQLINWEFNISPASLHDFYCPILSRAFAFSRVFSHLTVNHLNENTWLGNARFCFGFLSLISEGDFFTQKVCLVMPITSDHLVL